MHGTRRRSAGILVWASLVLCLVPSLLGADGLRIVELLRRSRREIHRRLLMTEGGGDLFAGDQALRQGEWAGAVESFRSAAVNAPPRVQAVALWGQARAYRARGRLDRAEALCRKGLELVPGQHDCAVLLGEICRLRGRTDEAERILRPIWKADPTHCDAGVFLARTLLTVGRVGEARAICDTLIDYFNTTKTRNAWRLYRIGQAAHLNGDFHGAVRILERAVAGKVEEALLESALVFLAKGQSGDARDELEAYLKLNPHDGAAHLAMARVALIEGPLVEAERRARLALAIDPSLVEARSLLADLALMDGNTTAARAEVAAARKVNDRHPGVLSRMAACHFLDGDMARFAEACRRVLSIDRHHAELYVVLAQACLRLRRMDHAEVFYRKAIETDRRAPRPRLGLAGILMARAAYGEARRELDAVHVLDPFSSVAVNWLKVLDLQEEEFVTRTPGPLVLRLHDRAEAVWADDLEAEALRHHRRLSERLGWAPKEPLQIEIMPDHRWLAARARGLPFAGLVGVCFGSVLAMDSPRALRRSFDWSSILAHEMSHAFHLMRTDSRVPIWLTEGLAQVEELAPVRRAFDQAMVRAFEDGSWIPLVELGKGFIRPRHATAHFQAYRQAHMAVAELLDRKDWPGMRAFLGRIAAGEDVWKALRAEYGVAPEALDRILRERARADAVASSALPRYGLDELPELRKAFKESFDEHGARRLGLALVHALDERWSTAALSGASLPAFELSTGELASFEGVAKDLRAFGGLSGDGPDDEEGRLALVRGHLHALAGRSSAALRAWKRATEALPRSALAWKSLAFGTLGRLHEEQARPFLEQAFRLGPKDEDLVEIHSALFERRRRWDEVERVLDRCLAETPGTSSLWLRLARARAARGRKEAVLPAVERALRIDPFDPRVLQAQARWADELGRRPELERAWCRIGRRIATAKERRELLASLASPSSPRNWQRGDALALEVLRREGWPLDDAEALWVARVAALPAPGRAAFLRGLAAGVELARIPSFRRGLRDAAPEVRLEAALGLASLDQVEAVPHLIHALRGGASDPRIQPALERLCCASPGTSAEAWHDWWRERRRLTLRGLGDEAFRRGGYEIPEKDPLREAALYLVALEDPQWYIRSRAASRLSGLVGVRICRGIFDRPRRHDDPVEGALLGRGRDRWKARVVAWRGTRGRSAPR